MTKKIHQKSIEGISTIEILIVVAFISIGLTGLLGVISYSLRVSTLVKENTQANFIAQETLEAVRNFRDGTDWDTNGLRDYILPAATTSGPYYPELDTAFDPPKWKLASGTETIDGFTRKIVFEKVSRDGNDNIEQTYNLIRDDPNTRKVIITISWVDKGIKLVTYLTNWK